MTIIILFHQSHYRDFKAFYLGYMCRHLRAEFPHLLSYTRFIALMPRVGMPLFLFLHLSLGRCTGIPFADSTLLKVCHNRRIVRQRVFKS